MTAADISAVRDLSHASLIKAVHHRQNASGRALRPAVCFCKRKQSAIAVIYQIFYKNIQRECRHFPCRKMIYDVFLPPLHFVEFYAIIAIKAEGNLFLSRSGNHDSANRTRKICSVLRWEEAP